MRNKIIYLFVAVMGLLIVTSCDHNNPNHDKFDVHPTEGYLRFVGEAPIITPATDSLHYVFENSAPVYSDEPIKVGYKLISMEGPDPNTFLHPASETVTIPAGENRGEFVFAVDPDVQQQLFDSDNQIILKLVLQTEDPEIQADEAVSTVQLKYPCKVEPAATYTAETSVPDLGRGPEQFQTMTIELEQVSENIYHVDNLIAPDWVGVLTGDASNNDQFPYPATLIFDPTTYNVDVVDEGGQLSSGGEGFYNPCKDVWTLDIHQTLFSGNPFDIHVELKN